jgi:hypothetical protein
MPPPPPAVGVVRYIEGMRAWDGRAVWASYAPDYQRLLESEGGGETATVSLYADLRGKGSSIDEVSYVGGYQTRTSGYFMYVTRHLPKGEDPTEVVWVFRTDEAGLIESIE